MTAATGPAVPSPPRDERAAALALELRAPLSRVELAASQLLREALTPAGRRTAERIGEAVREVDRGIARLLAWIEPEADAAAGADWSQVLGELRRRLAGVLALRGITWEEGPLAAAPGTDPGRARLLATALLRAAAARAGAGGRFRVELRAEEGGAVLSVRCRGGATAGPPPPAVEEARGLALSQGAVLETRKTADGAVLALRLPAGGAACSAC